MEAKDREAAHCDVCGTEALAKPVFAVRGFHVVRCPVCRVLRVSPRLTRPALQAYYAAEYWRSADSFTRGYCDYAGDQDNIRRTFRRRLQGLHQALGRTGRLLDVGCAFGFLVDEAVALGWDAYGVEWSEYAVKHAPAAIRARLTQGTLGSSALAEGSFDVVTFWDYLEHSPEPRQDIQRAYRLLAPGGWLSIIIPDAGSWLARLAGSRWEEYQKPEEHVYFFTGRQLQRLLQRNGLQVLRREWAGKYARLGFGLDRFRFGLARMAAALARHWGWSERVWYLNPHDKRHLLSQKEIG